MLWFIDVVLTGFMVLHVCSSDPKDKRDLIAVDPLAMLAVWRPPEVPKGCVKILLSNGRSIFVYGSEADVVAIRNRALSERSAAASQGPP